MGTSGLGNLLVRDGLLTEKDRLTVADTCGHEPAAFAKGILALGLLDDEELAEFLRNRSHFKRSDGDLDAMTHVSAKDALPAQLLKNLEAVPLQKEGDQLTVAVLDPLDRETIRQLEFFTGLRVKPVIATAPDIEKALKKLLPDFTPARSGLQEFLSHHKDFPQRKPKAKAAAPKPTPKPVAAKPTAVSLSTAAVQEVIAEKKSEKKTDAAKTETAVADTTSQPAIEMTPEIADEIDTDFSPTPETTEASEEILAEELGNDLLDTEASKNVKPAEPSPLAALASATMAGLAASEKASVGTEKADDFSFETMEEEEPPAEDKKQAAENAPKTATTKPPAEETEAGDFGFNDGETSEIESEVDHDLFAALNEDAPASAVAEIPELDLNAAVAQLNQTLVSLSMAMDATQTASILKDSLPGAGVQQGALFIGDEKSQPTLWGFSESIDSTKIRKATSSNSETGIFPLPLEVGLSLTPTPGHVFFLGKISDKTKTLSLVFSADPKISADAGFKATLMEVLMKVKKQI